MGKPKWRKSSGGSAPSSRREPKSNSPSLANVVTVESTLEKIHVYIESCDFTLAEKFAVRGIERFPENPEVLEAAAQCFTEVGHIQKARTCYQKAISASPLKGWRKYLGLAQICDGQEALVQYTRGIEVMEREIAEQAAAKTRTANSAGSQPVSDQMETSSSLPSEQSPGPSADPPKNADIPSPRDLSNAYLAISELYTTDLCDEENAEEICKFSIEKAMLSDPKNPESFQQMANLNLIKGEKELAKQFVKGGLSLWYKDGRIGTTVQAKTAQESFPDSGAAVATEDDQESEIPPLSFQIETAKALIECDEFELASQLFVDFIGQNPADPELWYLNGLSSFLHGPDFYAQARSDFKKAKRFSTTAHGVCYDIIAQCDEHLSTIAGVLPVDEADSEDDEDESNPLDTGNSAHPVDGVIISEEPDGSDWETDEETIPDVEMA